MARMILKQSIKKEIRTVELIPPVPPKIVTDRDELTCHSNVVNGRRVASKILNIKVSRSATPFSHPWNGKSETLIRKKNNTNWGEKEAILGHLTIPYHTVCFHITLQGEIHNSCYMALFIRIMCDCQGLKLILTSPRLLQYILPSIQVP